MNIREDFDRPFYEIKNYILLNVKGKVPDDKRKDRKDIRKEKLALRTCSDLTLFPKKSDVAFLADIYEEFMKIVIKKDNRMCNQKENLERIHKDNQQPDMGSHVHFDTITLQKIQKATLKIVCEADMTLRITIGLISKGSVKSIFKVTKSYLILVIFMNNFFKQRDTRKFPR